MDEINEQTENMRQIQEALSTPIGAAADFDEVIFSNFNFICTLCQWEIFILLVIEPNYKVCHISRHHSEIWICLPFQDELEAELEELEGAELEEQLLQPATTAPAAPVHVPAGWQPTRPVSSKPTAEEDELAALQAEMALWASPFSQLRHYWFMLSIH